LVLGSSEKIADIQHDGVIVAIGDNQLRSRIYSELVDNGEFFVNAIHPEAIVADQVSIGCGVVVCAGVIINPGAIIHNNVILNTGCSVDHHNIIHDHVHLAPGSVLGGDVIIKEGTLIGIGSTVLPQKIIGAWSSIGAGAVVTDNIPEHVTAVGIPAAINKPIPEEG